ncbi:MAG: hypothetical protein GF383_08820 [Candidatus Lokiarchaeota archaeon]|nr:hypothetical protein [Candidatus Lokiarchaeota archaeon]
MSRFKEDIVEAKERLTAWWDHEILDRPCISYLTPRPNVKLTKIGNPLDYFDPFFLAEHWEMIDEYIKYFEETSESFFFGGEEIPNIKMNYGPGIIAAVFGIVPKFQSRTVWLSKETPVDEIFPLLEETQLNSNNEWYARLMKATEFAAKSAKSDYAVTVSDIGGVLDVLSSFLGPTKLILTMRRNPGLISECRRVILDKLNILYDDLQSTIEKYCSGCITWMDIWCPKRWYPIQCDFSAFLSPKWFRKFALPDIKEQSESLDYSVYHLDGPDALKHLDDILQIPSITAVQWVPGAGNELKCSDVWMPVYKKIQKAGKSVIIDFFEDPNRLSHFYKNLDPKLLYTTNIFMDYIRAIYYVPEFIGGAAGKGSLRQFKKQLRKEFK